MSSTAESGLVLSGSPILPIRSFISFSYSYCSTDRINLIQVKKNLRYSVLLVWRKLNLTNRLTERSKSNNR